MLQIVYCLTPSYLHMWTLAQTMIINLVKLFHLHVLFLFIYFLQIKLTARSNRVPLES